MITVSAVTTHYSIVSPGREGMWLKPSEANQSLSVLWHVWLPTIHPLKNVINEVLHAASVNTPYTTETTFRNPFKLHSQSLSYGTELRPLTEPHTPKQAVGSGSHGSQESQLCKHLL